MFSTRTNWHREPNRLTELLDERRRSGRPIIDLTVSNPTECGIGYPQETILSALSNSASLCYHPDPHGLLTARKAIVGYYKGRNTAVEPENIFLTASTSEAYSLVFKLLCDPGDAVLVPRPSYPLFEYLAQLNDVETSAYSLVYHNAWQIDFESVRAAITDRTKAIVIVHPHNPTGMFIKQDEYEQFQKIAREHCLALIVDEVFIDYSFGMNVRRRLSTAGTSDVPTFTLNGISKTIGLPQMKLGWIVVSGESQMVREANERLEILCDTYLSVNTPSQIALPEWLREGNAIRKAILDRVTSNFAYLQNHIHPASGTSPLLAEGGWYTILRVPRSKSDERWVMELLDLCGVYVFPGYYFDFEEEGFLVASLLPEETIFTSGIETIVSHVQEHS